MATKLERWAWNWSHRALCTQLRRLDFLPGITGKGWSVLSRGMTWSDQEDHSGCRMENGSSSKTGGGGAGVSQGAAENISWRQHGEGEKGYSLGPDRYPQIQTRLCCSTSAMTLQSTKKLLIIASAKNKWDNVWPSDLQGLRHCRNISYQLFNYRSIIKSNHYFTLLSFIPIPDNQRQKIAHSQSLKASLVPLLSVNLGSPLNLWNGDTILLFAYFSGLPGGLIWRADIQEL